MFTARRFFATNRDYRKRQYKHLQEGMERIPVFFGYSQEAIQEFIDDLDSYFIAKDIATVRWVGILTKQLRGPARTQHTEVLVVRQSLEIAVVAAVAGGGGAAAIAAN